MFAPEQLDGYAEHDWIFNHNKKPFRSIFYGNKFPTGVKKVIEKIAFEECDFSGYLPDAAYPVVPGMSKCGILG